MSNNEHEKIRQQVWTQAWVAVASAANCKDSNIPKSWADRCLKEFDSKFPAPTMHFDGPK